MVKIVDYSSYKKEIKFIRNSVFTIEQKISPQADFDGLDSVCYHILAWDQNHNPIGTGRMQKDGHIGRLAVLSKERFKGIGKIMLKTIINFAKKNKFQSVYLHSQEHAIGFYKKMGFQPIGNMFLVEKLNHLKMIQYF